MCIRDRHRPRGVMSQNDMDIIPIILILGQCCFLKENGELCNSFHWLRILIILQYICIKEKALGYKIEISTHFKKLLLICTCTVCTASNRRCQLSVITDVLWDFCNSVRWTLFFEKWIFLIYEMHSIPLLFHSTIINGFAHMCKTNVQDKCARQMCKTKVQDVLRLKTHLQN